MEKIAGLPDGKTLMKMAEQTFDTKNPTAEQLRHVMTMLVPSMYALQYYRVKGHPITFSIPNKDMTQAVSHRPLKLGAL